MAAFVRANPHPFLPEMKIEGPLKAALFEWATRSLMAYLGLGLLLALIGFLVFRAFAEEETTHPWLTLWRGFQAGWGLILLSHGLLFLAAPGTLTTIHVLRLLPMGGVLLGFFIGGWFLLQWAFRESSRPGLRALICLGVLSSLLHLPHDIFRSRMPESQQLDPSLPRLVVIGVDGLRQDVVESLRPDFKAPNGIQPICVIPATRTSWHILMGGDPAVFSASGVIPFRSEWKGEAPLKVLEHMRDRHLRTAFLIDDPTTLSFGLKPTPFSEVLEPGGGWKHYFSMGLGATWPAYSWVENYFSPVETTNPWSDPRAYFRDIGRAMERNQFVAAHCVQLHAPFTVNLEEIQALRPWTWLFHAAKSYEAYQSPQQAIHDHFSRTGGRSNPVNHFRIRANRILQSFDQARVNWQSRFPRMAGVLTADHGELHVPLFNGGSTNVGFLTGIHGFSLEPDTVRVPLHAFGSVEVHSNPSDVFSWLDLRDALDRWASQPGSLVLCTDSKPWLVQFAAVQATHLLPPEFQTAGVEGAGITPAQIAGMTYLTEEGIWFMDETEASKKAERILSSALVYSDRMVTWNPLAKDRWIRQVWKGYVEVESRLMSESDMKDELTRFEGRHPMALP
jgi:hypothetical protein